MLFSPQHCISRHLMSVCPITDAKLDCLVKMMFTGSACYLFFFFFQLKVLHRVLLWDCKYLAPNILLSGFSIQWRSLPEPVITLEAMKWCFANVLFLWSGWQSSVKKRFSLPPHAFLESLFIAEHVICVPSQYPSLPQQCRSIPASTPCLTFTDCRHSDAHSD